MSRVVAVVQRKGGVGKTTVAVSIAGEIARRGMGVGLVDADPQGSSCQWAEPGRLPFDVYELSLRDRSVEDWAREIRDLGEDYVVIDCPPDDRQLGAAIAVATVAVIPCTPSGLDIEATTQTLAIVHHAKARRGSLPVVVLVANRVDRRTLEGRQVLAELGHFGEAIAPPLGSRFEFVRAFSVGQTIAEFAPNSRADHECRALGDFLLTCFP